MDRVSQLDLQECLITATSSGGFDLKEAHLRTFSGIAKKHGEAVNEATARCWDVLSTIEMTTPLQKHTKHLQREVSSLYSRLILSWKFIMFLCKKSQWAVRFILEQPRLNVFCKAILHLSSLVPNQRNIWEKPLAKKLATLIYEDMVRIGALVDNQPLRSALEFLKRKKVKSALHTAPTARTRTPIDRYYFIKHAISLQDAVASKLIQEIAAEFPDQIPAFRSRQVTSSFDEVPDSSPKKKTPKVTVTVPKAKEPEEVDVSEAVEEETEEDEDLFEDIMFEDVDNEEEPPKEATVEEEKQFETKDLKAASEPSPEDTRLEKYRQRNRDTALLVRHLDALQKKLAGIEDRSNWIPNQITDYNATTLRVTELLDALAACTKVSTSAITSDPQTGKGTQVIEFSSVKRL